MIRSKKDYKYYLKCDAESLGVKYELGFVLKEFLAPNYSWKFQKSLRKLEYYNNCKRKGIYYLYYAYLKYRFRKLSIYLGFSIPINTFGPGLAIVHYGSIIINSNTKVGKNCRIHSCVNIGSSGGSSKAPHLGDNVYIGPGAIIYGDITLGNNVAIGANATVNKSFPESNIVLAGSPAKIIRNNFDIKKLIKTAEI